MIDNIETQAKLLFNLKLNILEAGGMEAFHLQRHWKGKKKLNFQKNIVIFL